MAAVWLDHSARDLASGAPRLWAAPDTTSTVTLFGSIATPVPVASLTALLAPTTTTDTTATPALIGSITIPATCRRRPSLDGSAGHDLESTLLFGSITTLATSPAALLA